MNIDEGTVAGIVQRVGSRPLDETVLAELKQAYVGLRITHCLDDDIIAGKPVYQGEQFAIYLVGGGDHCLTLTNDFDIATGIVIAEYVEDEE